MTGEPRYVYSLSSRPRVVVQNAVRSITSLLRTTDPDPDQITVFATPPVDEETLVTLRRLGVDVRQVDPVFPGGFRTHFGDGYAEYAEKWQLTEVEANTVVFLDCDTVVGRDLEDVIEGDFDLKARPIEAADTSRFEALFEREGRTPRGWYPNTGFLVFRDGYHRTVADDWRRYIESELDYYSEGYTKEQFALSLAASEATIEKMSRQEHVMEWRGELIHNGYVYHIANGDVDVSEELLNALDGRLPPWLRNAVGRRFPGVYDRVGDGGA